MESKTINVRSVINKAMRKQPLTSPELEVVNLDKGAITLPYQTLGEALDYQRTYKSMKLLVDVIPVTERTGNYVGENEEAVTELSEFPLPDNEPHFRGVNWDVVERGSLNPVSSSLYRDSAFDLVTVLEKNHGKKAIKTENKLIFALLQEGKTPGAITNSNDLSSALIDDLDPSVETETVIVTNKDGWKKMKLWKDTTGQYLVKVVGTPEGPKRYYDGYPVEVFSNSELPSISGQAPVFYGAFKQVVKFFEYQTMDIKVSEAEGWGKFYHLVRGIESFDVKKLHNDYGYKLI